MRSLIPAIAISCVFSTPINAQGIDEGDILEAGLTFSATPNNFNIAQIENIQFQAVATGIGMAQSLMLASAYYATMGYAVPAALGAAKADHTCRPMVLVGDGAFLMTGLELLSAAYHGVKPIVIVVDNAGYGTQRPMADGPFNNIPALRSEELPKAFGVGIGYLCNTEDEFHAALTKSVQTDDLFIIRACVPQGQYSPGLVRLTTALKNRI